MLRTVLTLGPATSDESIIKSLLKTADRFRINTSHMDKTALALWLLKLEAIFNKTGRGIPVVLDLQGAKMRIGKYPAVDYLPENILLVFGKSSTSADRIPIPHKRFFTVVRPGDLISLNDARILLKIDRARKHEAEAVVINNGALSSRKGINRKEHPIGFDGLTPIDLSMIAVSKKYAFVEYAFSFVYDGSEVEQIRPHIGDHRLIAKVERPEAFEYITSIDAAFDEIWLCRGDLGAQAGIFELYHLQEDFSSRISSFTKRCFLAGQVLEHMTYFPLPTRSEVMHLCDIEKKGFHGIVLSDETAIGKNPLSVAAFLENYRSRI